MRTEEAFYNISMYLYNKNVLEYAEIARSGPKSMIRDIKGLSTVPYIAFKEYHMIVTKPHDHRKSRYEMDITNLKWF